MKKLTVILIVAAAIFPFVFSGCQIGYIPAAVNTPLFEEQGQTNLNLSALYKVDVQAAHSVTDNFFIHGDFSTAELNEDSVTSNTHNAFTVGVGYYNNITDVLIFEGLIGYGMGSSEVDYSKFIIQPTIATTMDHFEFAFTPRIVGVTYNEVVIQQDLYEGTDVFVEPTFTFRAGGKKVKFQTQMGVTIPVYYESDVEIFPFNFSIGVNFKFPDGKAGGKTDTP